MEVVLLHRRWKSRYHLMTSHILNDENNEDATGIEPVKSHRVHDNC